MVDLSVYMNLAKQNDEKNKAGGISSPRLSDSGQSAEQPAQINPAISGEAAYRQLAAEARSRMAGGAPVNQAFTNAAQSQQNNRQRMLGGVYIDPEAVKPTAPSDPAAANRSFLDRAGLTVSGGAKQFLGSKMDASGAGYEATQGRRDIQNNALREQYVSALEQAKKNLQYAKEDGDDLTVWQNAVDDAQRKLDAMGYVVDNKVQQNATNAARNLALDVSQSGSKDIEKAKDGASALGKFAIDAGTSMTQVGLDLAESLALGAAGIKPGMLPFATRAFGGGTQQARQEGATIGQQLLYGGATAAKEVLTEKMFNVALPFSKAYGGGSFDSVVTKAIGKAVDRFAKTEAGKTVLKSVLTLGASGISEGLEEFIGDWMEWQMPKIYGGDVSSAGEQLSNAIYDFAVGAATGVVGGAADINTYRPDNSTAPQSAKNAAGDASSVNENRVSDAPNAIYNSGIPGAVNNQEAEGKTFTERIASGELASKDIDRLVAGNDAKYRQQFEQEFGAIIPENHVQARRVVQSVVSAGEAAAIATRVADGTYTIKDAAKLCNIPANAQRRAAFESETGVKLPNNMGEVQRTLNGMKVEAPVVQSSPEPIAQGAPMAAQEAAKEHSTVVNKSKRTLTTREHRALSALSRKSGVTIVIDEKLPGELNGYYSPRTNTIHISSDSNNTVPVVAAHEIAHAIRQGNPTEWAELEKIARRALGDEAVAKTEAALRNAHYKEDQISDELVSHYVQTVVTDIDAFEELVGVNRNLAQRIVDALDAFLRKLKKAGNIGDNKDNDELKALFGHTSYGEAVNALQEMKKALSAPMAAKNAERANSVKLLSNGEKVISIDEDILNGVPKAQAANVVSDYMREHYKDGINVNGWKVFVTQKGIREFAWSKESQSTKRDNPDAFADKMRMASNLDEIVKEANSIRNELPKHPRNDNLMSFNRGNILVDVSGKLYSAEVVTGIKPSNKEIFYDIVSIKKVEQPHTAQKTVDQGAYSSNIKVPQTAPSVNSYSMQNNGKDAGDIKQSKKLDADYLKAVSSGDMETAQRMVDEAAKAAGFNSEPLYHGTKSFGFTKIDTAQADDKMSFFATSNPDMAQTYSGKKGNKAINNAAGNTRAMPIEDVVNRLNEEASNDGYEVGSSYRIMKRADVKSFLADLDRRIESLNDVIARKVDEYADRLAEDFSQNNITAHDTLVRLLEATENYRYSGMSTPLWMLSKHTDVFNESEKKLVGEIEADVRLRNRLEARGGSDDVVVREDLDRYSISVMSFAEAREELAKLSASGNYSLRGRTDNFLDVDGNNHNWNEIFTTLEPKGGNNFLAEYDQDTGSVIMSDKDGRFAEVHASTLSDALPGMARAITKKFGSYFAPQILSSAKDQLRNGATAEVAVKSTGKMSTRDIAKFAKEQGCRGVKISNIYDNGGGGKDVGAGDVYIFFYPEEDVKSTDPVTYDDSGNVIPLFERFNSENDDIRYSKKSNLDHMKDLADEHGAIPKGEKPARDVTVPVQDDNGGKVSRGARTIIESPHFNDEQTDQFAGAIADGLASYEPIKNKTAQKSAETIIRERGYDEAHKDWEYRSNSDTVPDVKTLVLGEYLMMEAAKAGDTEMAMRYACEISAAATRAGQTVQAMRLVKKLTPTGQLYFLNKMVDQMNHELQANGGENPPVLKINKEKAQKLAECEQIKDPKVKQQKMQEAVSEIEQDIADQTPATWWDKINAWRYMAMLGNLRTQVRNVAGNTMFAPLVAAKNLMATGLEKVAIRDPQKRTKAIVTPRDKAYLQYANSDFELMKDEIQGGGKYNEQTNIQQKKRIFKSNALEGWRVITNKGMDKGDEFFSRDHYKAAFVSFMKAQGMTLEILQSGTPAAEVALNNARNYAIKEAQKATFRDANAVAAGLNRCKKGLERRMKNAETKGGKIAWGAANALLEGVIPFTKTPANIMVRGIEYSPLGILKGIKQIAFDVRSGRCTAAEAIDSLCCGLTGTGIFMVGVLGASLGFLNGSIGDDKEGKEEKLTGSQKFSLVIGDKSYTLDWMSPLAMPLFSGVAVYDALSKGEELSASTVLDALSVISEPMLEMSMLQGLNDALSAGEYSSEAKIASFIFGAISDYISQFNPTILGQIARTIDPVSRNSYYYNPTTKGFMREAQLFLNKQIAKIPGLSMTLPARVDAWGREQQNEGGSFAGRLAYNMLSPGYVSTINETPVDKEVTRLYKKLGESSVLPSAAKKYFESDGKRYNLTADEYEEYAKWKGSTAYQQIEKAMASPYYKLLSDSEKAETIARIYKYAEYTARKETKGSPAAPSSSTYTFAKKAEKASKVGLSPAKYITMYTDLRRNYDKDNSGGIGKDEIIYYLERTSLTRAQKKYLFSCWSSSKNNPYA